MRLCKSCITFVNMTFNLISLLTKVTIIKNQYATSVNRISSRPLFSSSIIYKYYIQANHFAFAEYSVLKYDQPNRKKRTRCCESCQMRNKCMSFVHSLGLEPSEIDLLGNGRVNDDVEYGNVLKLLLPFKL